MTDNILKISSKSNASSVAGAIAGMLSCNKTVELHAIGAGAVNQCVKAIAIARGYTAPQGYDLVCVPAYINLSIDGMERTGIKFIVSYR